MMVVNKENGSVPPDISVSGTKRKKEALIGMSREEEKEVLENVEKALSVVLGVKKGEKVVVVTDREKEDVGTVFYIGAKEIGAKTELVRLPDNMRPLGKIPTDLANAFKKADVVINAFEGYPEETPFRIKLVELEIKAGARVGHAPGITMDMLLHGPMNADYRTVAQKAYALMEKFEDATEVHVTAPGGTDFTLSIEGRPFETDVKIKPGTIGNLPAGEIWCAPVEDSMNGILVCDGSIGDLGPVKKPLYIYVENGRINSIESEDMDMVRKVEAVLSVDEMAKVVGELGIGLNPRARLTGNLLEDEKAGGTAHIAFGRNIDMPGGRNFSKTHRDFLFYKPTFEVTYRDGTVRTVMKDGEIVD